LGSRRGRRRGRLRRVLRARTRLQARGRLPRAQQALADADHLLRPLGLREPGPLDAAELEGLGATEYGQHGIHLSKANNDRAAGYARLLELLHVEPGRIPPPWAQVREGRDGAPRLYVFSTCKELIRQFKSAPIAADELLAGEAVNRRWEGEHGHAVAAARYGAMSRPSPSAGLPSPEPEDPRHAYAVKRLKRIEERERGDFVDL
jgi:hypothetical protein